MDNFVLGSQTEPSYFLVFFMLDLSNHILHYEEISNITLHMIEIILPNSTEFDQI